MKPTQSSRTVFSSEPDLLPQICDASEISRLDLVLKIKKNGCILKMQIHNVHKNYISFRLFMLHEVCLVVWSRFCPLVLHKNCSQMWTKVSEDLVPLQVQKSP